MNVARLCYYDSAHSSGEVLETRMTTNDFVAVEKSAGQMPMGMLRT